MAAEKPRKKQSYNKRAHDVAAAIAEQQQTTKAAWDTVRQSIPSTYAEAADAVIESGGLSLLEIQALEYADHLYLTELLQLQIIELDAGARVTALVSALASVRLQSRKHMRSIAIAMNPGNNENGIHPELPPEVAEAYNAAMADGDDFGDDLIVN
jgi:hypothetical protein